MLNTEHSNMSKGFALGGAVIIAGLLLELVVGHVHWELFAAPVNYVVLALLLALIGVIYILGETSEIFRFLRTYNAAVPTLVYAVVLTIIMGCTRQQKDGHWIYDMLTFWPFVLIYLQMAIILGLVVLNHCRKAIAILRDHSQLSTRRLLSTFNFQLSTTINHLGLFIVLVAGTLGSADMQRLKMITFLDEIEWRAMDEQHQTIELPVAIELKRFIMEEYDDGSPRRFASDVRILTQTGKNFEATVEVNKPVSVDGYKIYQYGYDEHAGPASQFSILELVRDPWLPAVYTGIFMMLLGAACMLFIRNKEQGTKNKDQRLK